MESTKKTVAGPLPRVSIGMPVYNGEAYIASAIEAILVQTFSDFELIISDNASTDTTQRICMAYAEKDRRIRYCRNEQNLGAARNYNRLADLALGPFFRWSNADDLIEPALVEKCYTALSTRHDAVLCYAKTRIIDGEGAFVENYEDNLDLQHEGAYERFIRFHRNVGLSNVLYGLMRTETIRKTLLMGNFEAADYNLIGELSLYGKFIELPDRLFSRRMHRKASSWDRKNSETQREFWDPSKKRVFFTAWKQHLRYMHSFFRAPLTPATKFRLGWYMVRMMVWKRLTLWREIVWYMRYRLHKSPVNGEI